VSRLGKEGPGPSPAGPLPANLAEIIEARWFWFREVLVRLPGAQSGREEELTWVITGLPSAAFNVVLGGRFRIEGLEARLEATLDRFRGQGLPLTWWLGPSASPADLGARLEARGLVRGEELTGMALDLSRTPDGPAREVPPELKIERVADPEGLRGVLELFAAAMGASPAGARPMFEALSGLDFGPDGLLGHYLGRVAGRPVATASVLIDRKAAGLFLVSTESAFQGRGLARAMSAAALAEARSRGCRLAVLQATDLGRRLYLKLGFREHCRLIPFRWPA